MGRPLRPGDLERPLWGKGQSSCDLEAKKDTDIGRGFPAAEWQEQSP